ncbi:heterokaryon incompatibility protein-domain-containing protein [Stachybotrys elegans]|uniref:Heterokaryon incompatibility protein-domain-containing protein n=1 Tax=Stachybotrys elegans TaxID=80388 RepID=A0A8K0SHR1_9HYPO|nr:heterokaryon incompatibility protein-domain-containing protein [Stachybotrys elegans]
MKATEQSPKTEAKDVGDEDLVQVKTLIKLISTRITALAIEVEYMQERAMRLLSVLCVLYSRPYYGSVCLEILQLTPPARSRDLPSSSESKQFLPASSSPSFAMALYDKLPTPTSIRLLRIEAHPGTEVTCTLSVYSLSNQPTYNALSYTWASPSSEAMAQEVNADEFCPITLNGLPTMVTRNLSDFLHCFKSSKQEDKNGLLWIDAVCINQSDVGEKTHQVRLMAQIYRQATTVYVWLGKQLSNESAIDTLSLLAVICEMCSRVDKDVDAWDCASPMLMKRASDGEVLPPSFGIPWGERRKILSFLRRTWFSRIWIVQEVVVAKSVSMLWGDIFIPWDLAVKAASYIETTALGDYIKAAGEIDCHTERGCDDTFEHYHDAPSRVDLGNIIEIARLRDRYQKGESITLAEAIQSTWQFKATDKRDLIFALLGIVGMISPVDAADDLVVDYALPEESVFKQTARYLWKVERSYGTMLDAVVTDPSAPTTGNLPSWQPDYRLRRRSPLAIWATRPGSCFGINPKDIFTPEASGWQGDLMTTGRLTVGAVYVDQVEKCGEPIKQWRTSGGFSKSLEIILEMNKIYYNGQHRLEVFWRTLICNIWPSGPVIPAPADAAACFKGWILCTYFASYHSATMEGLSPNPLPAYLIEGLRDEEYDVIPNVFQFAVLPNPRSRSTDVLQPGASFHHAVQHFEDMQLFVTKKGYLGLGPATLQPGDKIWCTGFSKWLYALRESPSGKSPSSKQLVGAVYVHDLCNGNYADMIADGLGYKSKKIIQKAKDLDPDGNRTFGVHTKPDLVDLGAEMTVVKVIEGNARS